MAKIMIVDDSRIDRTILSRLLSHSGHDVIQAVNGVDAVNIYLDAAPDLVLMDLQMQRMGGIVALTKIMEMDPEARVVMVTASGDRLKVLEAIRFGAIDYVVKPYDPDRLMAAVESAINQPAESEASPES